MKIEEVEETKLIRNQITKCTKSQEIKMQVKKHNRNTIACSVSVVDIMQKKTLEREGKMPENRIFFGFKL